MKAPPESRCPHCRHPGIHLKGKALDGRPEFQCQKCGSVWTSGWDGEPYASWLRSQGEVIPIRIS